MPKRKRRKLTKEELAERARKAFGRKIRYTFQNAGFEYCSTVKKGDVKFGLQTGDIDGILLYENIILVYEETTTKTDKIKGHLKKTKVFYDDVRQHEDELINWAKENFQDKFEKFDPYINSEYHVFYLYFTREKLNPTEDDIAHFKPIKIVENSSLNYLQELTKNIRYSARSVLRLNKAGSGHS